MKFLYDRSCKDAFIEPSPSPTLLSALSPPIKTIMKWLNSPDPEDAIMWLDGSANSERSAICCAVTQVCIEQVQLSGAFSFQCTTTNATGKKDASRLIATLIYQLTTHIPETQKYIAEKIAADISILDRSWEMQLNALLVQPLVAVAQSGLLRDAQLGPRLFIIDGLDYCDDRTQCLVVEAFMEALGRVPESIPHKLLFSSQSESQLVSTCRKTPITTRLRRLHLDDSSGLSDSSVGIQPSAVESFMELKEILRAFQRESSGHRREADELVKRHSELEIREEEIRKREEEWKRKEAVLRKKGEWLRKKELEMLRKDEEEHREERQRVRAQLQVDEEELLEDTRRELQQAQTLLEEIEELQKENSMNVEEDISRRRLRKKQEMCGQRCFVCGRLHIRAGNNHDLQQDWSPEMQPSPRRIAGDPSSTTNSSLPGITRRLSTSTAPSRGQQNHCDLPMDRIRVLGPHNYRVESPSTATLAEASLESLAYLPILPYPMLPELPTRSSSKRVANNNRTRAATVAVPANVEPWALGACTGWT